MQLRPFFLFSDELKNQKLKINSRDLMKLINFQCQFQLKSCCWCLEAKIIRNSKSQCEGRINNSNATKSLEIHCVNQYFTLKLVL